MQKHQRKTLIALTLTIILSLTLVAPLVEAKPSKLPKGLQKKIPKSGFIVREDLGAVIRYWEYIPLDPEIANIFSVDSSMLEDITDNPFYSVNVYAYETEDSVIVIDAGHELLSKKLYACLVSDFGKKPLTVLLTHGHADHAGGGSFLQKKGADVYVSYADEALVQYGYNFSGIPEDFTYTGYQPLIYQTSSIADLVIIPTPGHTYGSVSLYQQATGILFSGDLTITMFEETNPRDFTSEVEYFALKSLPSDMSGLQMGSLQYILSQVGYYSGIYSGHNGPYIGTEDMMSVILMTMGAISGTIPYP